MTELNEVEIIIVEDEELIAEDIKEICEANGYKIIDVCYNAASAFNALQNKSCDMALLDIKLSGSLSGLQLARQIQKLPKKIPFIFITSFSDSATLQEAKGLMPFGYIVKPFTRDQLISTIEISLYNASEYNKPKNMSKIWLEETFNIHLSDREYEILQLICDAKTNEQISKLIFVSVNTVKFHIKNLFEKLAVNSRAQLINLINLRN